MVLVTGANGLMGSYLCRYLLMQGEKVRALKRPGSDLRLIADIANQIEFVDGDILDLFSLEDAMEGVKHVYHCAAIISYSKKNRDLLMQVNVEGTTNVMNIALDKKIEKVLHCSSIAAIGRTTTENEIVNERTPWERKTLTSDYSVSKFLAEREVWRCIAEGLNAVIINPSIIVGAGDWNKGSCKLFATVYNGFKYYTDGITGYVDVRDVVKIAYALMQSDISNERYILNSENVSYHQFLSEIAKGLKVKGPDTKAGKFLSSVAWRAEWFKSLFNKSEPSVTKQTASIANKKVHFENSKIRETLSYQFIPINKSVADAAASFTLEKKQGKFVPLTFE